MTIGFAADDSAAFAARVRSSVGKIGGGFFLSSQAKAAGKDLGLRGWPTYFVGRCGVLGDIEADVVAAVCGFYPIDFVRRAWSEGREVDLTLAVEVYLQACGNWGRQHLADFPDNERLAELSLRVVEEASPIGSPLFAGWRTMPLPDDAAARVAQLMTTLRELRGGLHLVAILASGISPYEAVVTGPGGPANAEFFGWKLEELTEERREFAAIARAEAERLTNRLVGASWDALGIAEKVEFATLVDAASLVALPPVTAVSSEEDNKSWRR